MREELIQPNLQKLRNVREGAKEVTDKLKAIPAQQALQLHLKIQRPDQGSLSGGQICRLTAFLKREKPARAVEDLQHNIQGNESGEMMQLFIFVAQPLILFAHYFYNK